MAAAWTGVDLLIHGGASGDGASTKALTDGAAYDSETAKWRPLPSPAMEPRYGAASVIAETRWLVWGGYGEGGRDLKDGAVFDGEKWDLMERLPESVEAPVGPTAFWTGEEMLVFGSFRGGNLEVIGAAYSLDGRSWRALASAPFQDWALADAVWTGDQLLVWHASHLYEYLPAVNEWRSIQRVRWVSGQRSGVSVVWTGGRLLVWGGTDMKTFFNDGIIYSSCS